MFTFEGMSTIKITENLKKHLQQGQSQSCVTVLIELTPFMPDAGVPAVSRSEKIALHKNAFNKELQPVAEAITIQGGEVTDAAWINHTLQANVSPESIEALAQLKEVQSIDLPRQLMRD